MNSKLFAVSSVILMVAVCFVCVASPISADDNVIESDDSVIIYTDGTFKSNEKQLNKLGITSPSSWSTDAEGKNQLTLDNIHFKTTANIALVLVDKSNTPNPGFTLKLEGDSSIVSGDQKNSVYDDKNDSIAILALHYYNATALKDFDLDITGNGTLSLTNDVSETNIRFTCGISVHGELEVTGGATVLAYAATYYHVCVAADQGTGYGYVYSVGAYAYKISVNEQSKLVAVGGDVHATYLAKVINLSQVYAFSSGTLAYDYDIKNGTLFGSGGDVDNTAAGPDFDIHQKLMETHSIGIDLLQDSTATRKNHVTVENSIFKGFGGDARGMFCAISKGIEIDNDGEIEIKNSVVAGVSGDAITTVSSPKTELIRTTFSAGIHLYQDAEIVDSYVYAWNEGYAMSVKEEKAGQYRYCDALSSDGNLTLRGSSLFAKSEDEYCGHSFGVCLTNGDGVKKNLVLDDSDVYASGCTNAVNVNGLEASSDFKYCKSYIGSTWVDKKISELTNVTNFKLAYKNIVVMSDALGYIVGFERVDGDSIVLQKYKGDVPDGMQFHKWDVNGEEYSAGDTVSFEESVLHIMPVFSEKSSGGDNNLVIWVIAIVVVLAIIALIAFVMYSRKK